MTDQNEKTDAVLLAGHLAHQFTEVIEAIEKSPKHVRDAVYKELNAAYDAEKMDWFWCFHNTVSGVRTGLDAPRD